MYYYFDGTNIHTDAIYYNDDNVATVITNYAAINSAAINNWSESIVGKDGLQHTIILSNY